MVAKLLAARWTGSPGIADQSCGWRRSSSVTDVRVVLRARKIPEHVKRMRKIEQRRNGVERGLGTAEVHRKQWLTAATEAMC